MNENWQGSLAKWKSFKMTYLKISNIYHLVFGGFVFISSRMKVIWIQIIFIFDWSLWIEKYFLLLSLTRWFLNGLVHHVAFFNFFKERLGGFYYYKSTTFWITASSQISRSFKMPNGYISDCFCRYKQCKVEWKK